MRILGIDPGISGGLALWCEEGLYTARMPILKVGSKSSINIGELTKLVTLWKPTITVLEKQQVMPKAGVSQGSVSSFRTGLNYGVLLGFMYGRQIAVEEVVPSVWKKALGLSSDKDASRYKATQLWPENSTDFSMACQDGVAEAALIAYYYKRVVSVRI